MSVCMSVSNIRNTQVSAVDKKIHHWLYIEQTLEYAKRTNYINNE